MSVGRVSTSPSWIVSFILTIWSRSSCDKEKKPKGSASRVDDMVRPRKGTVKGQRKDCLQE
jgi:hypothetical protein